MTFILINHSWVELGNIPDTFEKKGVSILAGSLYQFFELSIIGQHICVSLVGSQVYSQCNQLLSNDWLWTVNNQLVNQRNAIGISEGGFSLIFKTQVVQKLDDLGSETWSFKGVDQLRDHSLVVHLDSNFLVK